MCSLMKPAKSIKRPRADHRAYDDDNGARLQIRVSGGDRQLWERAAEYEGMSLSAWVRRAANRAVELEAARRVIQ